MKPFYIGQEVVAICDGPEGVFKKGDEFKITGVFLMCCSWEVTVGITAPLRTRECTKCGKNSGYSLHGQWQFYAERFAPKLQLAEFISMKELSEQQLEKISAN